MSVTYSQGEQIQTTRYSLPSASWSVFSTSFVDNSRMGFTYAGTDRTLKEGKLIAPITLTGCFHFHR